MDGWMDGWIEGGRQADSYHNEVCYHKYFKCPAINCQVLMTLDKSTSQMKQGLIASQFLGASFPTDKGDALYLPILWPHSETNWQLYIFNCRRAGFRNSCSCKG